MTAKQTTVDGRLFRDVLGCYPTGVVIITAMVGGQPVGMVVGSFTSVSLDPPLIAYLPAKSSNSYSRLKGATAFCVNVLSKDQEVLCRQFASKSDDKFTGVSWSISAGGAPVLADCAAWIDCSTESIVDGGDHDIVLGRVRDLGSNERQSPLLFFQGGYGGFRSRSLVAPFSPDLRDQLAVADEARGPMERLVEELHVPCYAQTLVDGELVIIAEAGVEGRSASHIGRRMPFIPPYGALFLDDLEPETAVRTWEGDLSPVVSARSHETHVAMLRRVRDRSYSIGLVSPHHDDIWAEVERFTAETPTPARSRRLGELLDELTPYYEPHELPAGPLDVRIISAPVRLLDRTILTLNIYDLPRQSSPRSVERWASRVRAAGADVSTLIASA